MPDLGATSHCCAGYSIVGAIFTLWVGIMLTTQPFFIAGIEDVEVATRSAFGAFFTFMFVFVLSAVGMWYDSTFGKKSAAEEGDGETDYQLAGGQEFPNYGTSS
ncbi:hypothetical protein FRACYDRAFT_267767 [Fragilariopsis cylindrus CCMP1102]|uniref:Uncharacterized protein n=1 Tax=Fragilariopsis cylindrus CCMP1102 TaxID=635003 RepID=A0A1E7FRJ2_9STRA|nr:hypothetical protein FRACYDRAFT_267767 [Fragilariopsis cylindrus CCMP1102]|eukprot:OEU20790.1 hypothetical protein FRACYDRAFT_267767 [Fragilariopsis cylindrus CCMP1102]